MSIIVIKIWLGVLCVLAIIKNTKNIQKLEKEYFENRFFLPKKLKREINKSLNNNKQKFIQKKRAYYNKKE